jgi:hypothetical protein
MVCESTTRTTRASVEASEETVRYLDLPKTRESVLVEQEHEETRRLWEAEDMRDIRSWDDEQLGLALQLVKQLHADYESLIEEHNTLLERCAIVAAQSI